MLLLPIHTRLLKKGDDLASLFQASTPIREGDIVVVSSKAVATAEGAAIDLRALTPSKKAERWSAACGRSPAFCQAVIEEVRRRNGTIVGTCPGALLTELRPQGRTKGTIFAANAGLDQSNVAKGWAVGWPRDPVASVRKLRKTFSSLPRRERERGASPLSYRSGRGDGGEGLHPAPSPPAPPPLRRGRGGICIGVVLSDSCCIPRRRGVIAYALAVSGIDPLASEIGHKDLFGTPLRITVEALADQLATAANILMGNAGQGVPAAIIRDHGIPLTHFEGWVPGIEPEHDLFRDLFRRPRHTSAADRSAESA